MAASEGRGPGKEENCVHSRQLFELREKKWHDEPTTEGILRSEFE